MPAAALLEPTHDLVAVGRPVPQRREDRPPDVAAAHPPPPAAPARSRAAAPTAAGAFHAAHPAASSPAPAVLPTASVVSVVHFDLLRSIVRGAPGDLAARSLAPPVPLLSMLHALIVLSRSVPIYRNPSQTNVKRGNGGGVTANGEQARQPGRLTSILVSTTGGDRWGCSPPTSRRSCPRTGRSRAGRRRWRSPTGTSSSARRCSRRSPTASSRPSSAWAASGAPSASSGRPTASTRPRSATTAATRRTRRTRKSAPAAPVMPRSSSSSSTRPRRRTTRCSPSSSRATIRRRGCARATTSAPSTGRPSTRRPPPRRKPPGPRSTGTRRRSAWPATGRSRPRSRPPGPSITPRRTTSSTWRPTRTVIAGSVGPACPARSASSAVGPRVARPRLGQPRARAAR